MEYWLATINLTDESQSMITPDDIKLLVTSGEGFNAEFKVSVPSKVKEISEEVCALQMLPGELCLLE